MTSPVVVVGIGADGLAGVAEPARQAVLDAEVIIGATRQLGLLPEQVRAQRVAWPSPLRPAVAALLAEHADRRTVVLASGDPMHYGIGRALVEEVGAAALHVIPHPSSISLACARLGWPVEDTDVVSAVGRDLDAVAAHLYDRARVLVLCAGAHTPAQLADLLVERGFGASLLHVCSDLGAADEAHWSGEAASWPPAGAAPSALTVAGIDCVRDADTPRLGLTPGRSDDAYLNDGQLTKWEIRAATLAALAPQPGELLWDVGGGSGSIGIEWMRAHPRCRAISVEPRADRAARIAQNAARLGVPGLQVVHGRAPGALDALPRPDVVFIGGGLTVDGVVDACWAALRPGGRLVANTVTLESEAFLLGCRARYGGALSRIEVARADAIGTFTSWTPMRPVTQWVVDTPVPTG